ncbi:S-layer homology domain-containing protein [Paenibacillus sp. GM1FR]|uniref:S-layer homology domain-containing protein n=1 Tax=Paenibacillus sp. GM1FR TaxID=2059267 RepID=UPI001FAF6645|nr:S-layer homology domain-containing protein [Paenibacillus sp. GM1FR]
MVHWYWGCIDSPETQIRLQLPHLKMYLPAIDVAVANGYFKGYIVGTFKPGRTVTRAELATFLA